MLRKILHAFSGDLLHHLKQLPFKQSEDVIASSLAQGANASRADRDFHPPALAEAYIAEDNRVMKSKHPILN